jgi:hypothetical protein
MNDKENFFLYSEWPKKIYQYWLKNKSSLSNEQVEVLKSELKNIKDMELKLNNII